MQYPYFNLISRYGVGGVTWIVETVSKDSAGEVYFTEQTYASEAEARAALKNKKVTE